MNFLVFLLYYVICTIILGLVFLVVYRFIVKSKCRIVEKTAAKAIDDYFKAYDTEFETLNDNFFPHMFGSEEKK